MRCWFALLLSIAGCAPLAPGGPIAVSVIDGGPARQGTIGATGLAVRAATGIGLVRFDQAGQLIPGAAARWAVVDDGLGLVFRIDDTLGADAGLLARRLRASIAGPGRRLYGDAVTGVAAVTDAVIEVRLAEPRSDLLPMLADPVLATLAPAGPFRVGPIEGGATTLRPRAPSDPKVTLQDERAGRAVAGFAAGRRVLVLGGTFADLAVARVAMLPRGALRFDPASGLFGFVARARSGAYAEEPVQRALSLALDRDRIVASLAAPTPKATTIAGSQAEAPLTDRRAEARALLSGRTLPPLGLALPEGPGARLLFRLLQQDWGRLGIEVVAAPARDADFVLIDQVLPPGERARAACLAAAGCDPADKRALLAPPFVPIAQPVRWALVAPSLDLFTENALARHPLDRLRSRR